MKSQRRPRDVVAAVKANHASDGRAIAASHRLGGAITGGVSESQFRALLEHSPDAIAVVDTDGLVVEWNPAAELISGTSRPKAVGVPVRTIFRHHDRKHFDDAWQQLLAGSAAPRFEVQWSKDGGDAHPYGVIVAPVRSSGALVGAVVILRDLTARNTMAVARQPMESPPQDLEAPPALADSRGNGPGGLPGRAWLQRRLADPPAAGTQRGVAVFDIDVFSMVNASHGPDAADGLVNDFAELLRMLDTPGAFAHWRDDVFVMMVDSIDPVGNLNECISSVTAALEAPFAINGDDVWLTLSIGLATTSHVAGDDLLGAAKDALQFARQAGGSNAVYYDESMAASALSGFRLVNDLHHAIGHEQLRLHYQPIIDFATNEMSGVEALVRWERPGFGLLAPDAFIEAAERTGQIVPLGNWVVRQACNNASRLGNHSGGLRTMSINVSARQLRDPGLIDTLREAMVEGECGPSSIVVEVTESVLLHDLHLVADVLEAIKTLGVGVDLDDFGTGYSSLQYLRDLPIDRLKVDQVFVAGLGSNSADTAIVASTIALAHALGLQTLAEGVETEEQFALLRELGCDFAQGYLISRPVDIDTLSTWLDAYTPATASPTASESATAVWQERAHVADRREATADAREVTANEREVAADLRDATLGQREITEDNRERANGRSGNFRSGRDSGAAQRAAKSERSRAAAKRVVEASGRAQAGESRAAASAESAGEPSAEGHADAPSEGGAP